MDIRRKIFEKFPQLMKIFLYSLVTLFIIPTAGYSQRNESLQLPDSVLKKFNIEDLVKIKKLLERERERLMNEQQQEQQRGIELSKDFLSQTRAENENQDMILIRVAEYYIDEASRNYDDEVAAYNRAYEEYEKKLAEFEAGNLKVEPVAPQFPRRNYEKAIGLYDLILTNFSESELADDALYNKAYLLGEMAEEEASKEVYQELIDKYPESEYIPEAYMHLAEFYFQPKLGQDREETIRNLNKAAQLYKNVLKFKDSPRYADALYKLGWTYYRLAAADPNYFNDAIIYFTFVVQDIEKFQQLDPEGKFVKANIKPEALQYIAASFVDTSYTKRGVAKAEGFIQNIGMPEFGVDILGDMGDLYARIVDYDNSILAYSTLLQMYPDYAYAPRIGKKIADVYLENQEPSQAYMEREKLFQGYNPKTEWYANIELSDLKDRILILDEATQLTEEALRANIIYQLNMAEAREQAKGDSMVAYQEFASLAKVYLETYPTHENAYEIDWSLAFVLDTELKRYREAFEEYIRVSNDYLEDSHRKDAATNAIVVAQTLVDELRQTKDTTQIGGIDMAQMTAQELTDQEKMLAEAFDNYIKLYPDDERTPTYLASAGALYYQHRQYDLARKYYKTMVTKFPEAQQRSVGLLSLMNSYFFLGNYADAEFVAKKIVDLPDLPEDQREVASKRIGESIYKNAEKLEQEERYAEAAKEFFRVYIEARYYKDIVDLALFNSAKNYEQIDEWLQAIAVYDTLVVNFPESEYRLIALGHIADDYKQMEDYAGVGAAYERIFILYPEHKDAEAALYNASLFYAKANSWRDAIRVNNSYIQKYPDNPDSKDLLFENARYYLKLDDLASANRIYDEFAQRYPDDRRTIEAYFRRGEYYYDNDQFSLAKQEFRKAINRSDEFARTGRDPNLLYASESYFKLGEIEYKEYKDIKLTYPESNIRAQLQQKQNKQREVVNAFTTVIKMGSAKGFEAMYKVAESYEVMADAIAQQELSPNLSPEQRLVERDRVFKASVPAYDRAVDEYKNVIKNVPILAEKLDVSLFDTTSVKEPEATSGYEDSTLTIQKEAMADSTREIALKWYNRAEDKISLMLYTVAERSSEFIQDYLRQQNPEKGLRYLSWKKLLLEKAVTPAVNVTLTSHLKNINVSRELGLTNKYEEESERKILLTSDIIADEYAKLFYAAVDIYRSQFPVLQQLIEGGEQATTPDGMNSLDFNDQLMSNIDYMNEFLTIALNQYSNTLKFARDNQINNDAVLTTQDRLFNLSYESSITLLDLAKKASDTRDNYEALADTTGDPKYELGIVYLYDQQSILNDYAKRDLESSYQVSKDYDVKNVWTNLILAKLVELDPAQYLGDMPREIKIVQSDDTWRGSDKFDLDWTHFGFNDSVWKNASIVNLPIGMRFAGFDTLDAAPQSIWLYSAKMTMDSTTGQAELEIKPVTTDTTLKAAADTLARPRSLDLEDKEILEEGTVAGLPAPQDNAVTVAVKASEPDTLTAYFRKAFTLEDRAINGWVLLTADDQYHFYLNGEYIKGDNARIFENVDKVTFIEISDFLKVGNNEIAVDVTDFDGPPRNGLRFYLHLELLPGEITAAADRIRRKAAENIDEARLVKVDVLNKNRIPR